MLGPIILKNLLVYRVIYIYRELREGQKLSG